MDIKCIGYKVTFHGAKIYHYKLILGIHEHLIIDSRCLIGRMMALYWSSDNKFIGSSLSKEEMKEMESIVDALDKIETVIENDDECVYFLQNKIKKKEPEPVIIRKNKKYTKNEVNNLLQILGDMDFFYFQELFFRKDQAILW